MPLNFITKIKPLAVFYRSTLTLSLSFSAVFAVFGLLGPPALIIRAFAVSFMSGGTICSLLYRELTLKNEYYFYYNLNISKTTLILTFSMVNTLVGVILIVISMYV